MEPKDYIVIKIDGDYAVLRDTEGNELPIARALIPVKNLPYPTLPISVKISR